MVEAVPGGSTWSLQGGNGVFLSCIDLHLARKELLYSGSPTPSTILLSELSVTGGQPQSKTINFPSR